MKKKLILMLVMTLVASMFLAACAPKEPATGDVEDPKVVYVGSERGNVLTIGDTAWNGLFNPITSRTVYDRWVADLVFDRLLQWNDDTTLTTNGRALAESYTEEDTVITFNLRKGIKFHDGVEMTANDVAFTFDAVMRPDYEGVFFSSVKDIVGAEERRAGTVDWAEGIKVIDDYTIQFTMTEPRATNLRNVGTMWIIPQHYYDKASFEAMSALDRDPVGTGPFMMNEHVLDQYVDLKANPDYWLGAPKLDGIIYRHVANVNQLAEFEIGTVDVVNFNGSIENYEIIEGPEYSHGTLINNWNNGYAYAGFNFTNPIFQDQRVRQAIVYGIDRHGFVQSFFGDKGGMVANSPISPVSWAFPDTGINEYKFNQQKAAELLDDAGWKLESDGWRYKDGKKLSFTWKTYQEAEWAVRFPALAQENLKDLGIEVEIELMDFNSLATLLSGSENKGDWDVFNMAWGLGADPDMQGVFKSTNTPPGNNRGYYANAKIDELMEKGVLELDQTKRTEIYHELAREFNEDLPYIFVYLRTNPFLVNDRIDNFHVSEYVWWTARAHEFSIKQ